jgi:hypothetical protein
VRAIDSDLRPSQAPSALNELGGATFICHRCERIFKATVDELVYVVDSDMAYHEHDDALFRAFVILEDGTVQIGAFDSVEDEVIQLYRIDRPGTDSSSESLEECSRAFFNSMRRQNRNVVPADLRIEFS